MSGMPVIINGVPLECINRAAIINHVPAVVILSVLKKEGGRNGDALRNKNGTVDYGVMQINSIWLPKISAYGYTREDIQYDPCKNVMVGAWIIGSSMAASKSVWTGIANYYSKTPSHNKIYRESLYASYQKIADVIVSGVRWGIENSL